MVDKKMILEESKEDDPHPFMNLAKKESTKSVSRFKLGAVLAKGNKKISSGWNRIKTHRIYGSKKYRTIHAEGDAIRRAVYQGHYDLSGHILYVYRKNGLLSKPCRDCIELCIKFGVKKIIYNA